MQVQRLVWLGVPTQRFDETVAFFQHVLGIDLELQEHDFAVLRLPDGGTIEVFGPSLAVQEQFVTGPIVGVEVADVAAARSELEKAGMRFIGPIHPGVGGAAWSHFYGPEGHVYELTQIAASER